ncbi:MAG: hypothetical protein AAGE84_29065 [Cyanobacteria bacterium P01_G01_bin.39]
MTSPVNKDDKFRNTGLIYDYTESVFDSIQASIEKIDTKLATIIGFGGVILKFTLDLPGKECLDDYICYSCLIFKILACIGAIISICTSVYAFTVKKITYIVSPRELHREWLNETEERCKLRISRTWRNSIEDLEKARDTKIRYLNMSLIALAAVSIFFGADIIIYSILQ